MNNLTQQLPPMDAKKADIFTQLQKDILSLQGYRAVPHSTARDIGLGPINAAFPNASFPLGAVHEFLSAGAEDTAATGGFIAGLLSALMQDGRASVWISSSRTLFPPSLKIFGIEPDRIIFIDLPKEKDILWVMEEALKCGGLAAVVGEMRDISFIASRRLQLAVEQSRVTGFIVRHQTRNPNAIACVSRWKIRSLPSEIEDNMPGVGFPRWNVELLKSRNGKPGIWQVEWVAGKFRHNSRKITSILQEQKKKAG